MGRGAVQDGTELGIDVLAMSSPATGLSVSAASPAKAAHAVLEAFRRAIHGSCPVHISLPLDVQTAELGERPPLSASYRAPRAAILDTASDALQHAAALLSEAERPALLIGNGARGAWREVRELAERLGCPVATTCNAKGVFPEDHPLSLGVFSFGSGPLARAVLLTPPDVLCVVGSRLGEFSSMNHAPGLRPSRALIHIDREPSVVGRDYEALALVGDAAAALAALARAVTRPERVEPWCDHLLRTVPRVDRPDAAQSDAIPLRPERVMAEIEAALPPDARVVADIGTSCLFVAHCLRLSAEQRSYIPMAWSCMAHPVAASLGVRLGSGKATLCVTGDAAFLSKALELHAAVEAGVGRFVWVVLTNRGHGLVRFGTEKLLGPGHGVEAGDFRGSVDAAQIARAVGAEGLVVERPEELGPALRMALSARLPMVLDVRVDPHAEPPMADRIQGLRSASGTALEERT
jgi:acetolactate synthase-1/2/3 large subunit